MTDNLVDITQQWKYRFEALNTTQINNPAANISTSAKMFSRNCTSPPYPMPHRIFSTFDLENTGDSRDLLIEPQVVRTPHIYLAINSPQLPTRGAFGSLGLDTLTIVQTGDFFCLSQKILPLNGRDLRDLCSQQSTSSKRLSTSPIATHHSLLPAATTLRLIEPTTKLMGTHIVLSERSDLC